MQMQHDEEFSKAFMGGAPEQEPAELEAAAPEAAAEEAADTGTEADVTATGDESDGNSPTADAAEGAAETPAAAVVLNGEGDDDSDVPAEDMQAFKSWRGRLEKREQELKAREAALAEREKAPAVDPVALADGGKVKDGGEKWDRLTAVESRVHDKEVEGPDGETQLTYNGSNVDLVNGKGETVHTTDDGSRRLWGEDAEKLRDDFNNAPKMRLADGGEVEGEPAPAGDDTDDILKTFEADYGPEFVAALDKLVERRARAIVEEMGGAYVSDLSSRIDNVLQQAQEGMGRMHGDVLAALREDAEQIANAPEFQQWVAGLEGDEKANAERVVESGSLREVLALLKQYDASQGGNSDAEDVWAEGAAAGVKGSAPVRLPTRAPASPNDEYAKAWEQF